MKKKEDKQEEQVIDTFQNLKVHQMPKKYRSGSFDYVPIATKQEKVPTKKEVSSQKEKNKININYKKIVIILLGLILLGAASYGVYYLINKDISWPDLLSKKNESVVNNEKEFDINVPMVEAPEETASSTDELLAPPILIDPELSDSIDSDGDGLTDVEEDLFGTDKDNSDSDGDTYSDLIELLNLYNPLGDGDIYDAGFVKKYKSTLYGYSLAYPKSLSTELIDNGASVVFKIPDDSFIQVIVKKNSSDKSIKEWYDQEFPVEATPNQLFENGQFSGIKSTDGLIYYFMGPQQDLLYIISYTPLEPLDPIYGRIMELMMKSFSL